MNDLAEKRDPIEIADDQHSIDDVLDVAGAAHVLHVGRDTIYAMCARQSIPHRRVGKALRFSRSALLRWLGGETPA